MFLSLSTTLAMVVTSPMHAFIAGASGLIGGECLKLLLERYSSVTALVRRPLGISHARLTELQVDFSEIQNIELPERAHVFCTLGTTLRKAGSKETFLKVEFDYPLALARRAAATGSARFVIVTAVDANATSLSVTLRTKARLEDALAGLSLPLHVLRPSFVFADLTKLPRAKRIWLIALGRSLVTRYRPIDAQSLARAMVAAAMSPGAGTHVYHHDEIRVAADRF